MISNVIETRVFEMSISEAHKEFVQLKELLFSQGYVFIDSKIKAIRESDQTLMKNTLTFKKSHTPKSFDKFIKN